MKAEKQQHVLKHRRRRRLTKLHERTLTAAFSVIIGITFWYSRRVLSFRLSLSLFCRLLSRLCFCRYGPSVFALPPPDVVSFALLKAICLILCTAPSTPSVWSAFCTSCQSDFILLFVSSAFCLIERERDAKRLV